MALKQRQLQTFERKKSNISLLPALADCLANEVCQFPNENFFVAFVCLKFISFHYFMEVYFCISFLLQTFLSVLPCTSLFSVCCFFAATTRIRNVSFLNRNLLIILKKCKQLQLSFFCSHIICCKFCHFA